MRNADPNYDLPGREIKDRKQSNMFLLNEETEPDRYQYMYTKNKAQFLS